MRKTYTHRYFHVILFLLLSTWITVFLAYKPFLFLLDSVPPVNKLGITNLFYGKAVPVYGGWFINAIILFLLPPFLYQKFFVFLIIFLSCYSAYSLSGMFTRSEPARIYAALLYAINPYTYIRIIVGHFAILFAYSILPLALKYFIRLLEGRDKGDIIKFALSLWLIANNAHTLFISFLVLALFLFLKLPKTSGRFFKQLLYAATLFFVLNAYWLIPLITAQKETILTHISSEDLAVFAPRIESFSALFTLASMHGFWRAGYIYAKDFLPFWWILFIFILFLAVHGFVSYYRDEGLGIYVKAFALTWLVGLILAAGIRSPFAGLFRFLFDHIPLLKGMRDTHKFVTMLCLSYSCLGGLGLAKIEKSLKNKKPVIKKAITIAALLLPLIYSFTFFNGFAGQIKPTDFPKDWYEIKVFLDKDKDDFRVLFFPWHLYMDFHWVPNKDKRIANPAPLFFDKEVISGKNIEVPGIYRQIYTPYQVYIDYLLSKKNEITNFGKLVSILGVKYILLTKEVDYRNYFFLFNQTDLKLVLETPNFYVFKNKAFKGLMFSVNGIAYVKNWDELINISKTHDITERLYLIGNGREEGNETSKTLKFERVSPVEYVIRDKPLKYIIFTEEYSKEWKLNGEKPLKAYGVVNAYFVVKKRTPEKIIYGRFYKICLPSYIISVLGMIIAVFCWKKNLKT